VVNPIRNTVIALLNNALRKSSLGLKRWERDPQKGDITAAMRLAEPVMMPTQRSVVCRE